MSRNYKFHNPEGLYFISFAVVDWLDVFTKDHYIEILVDSLRYCQANKGLELIAWCIMTNHVHLIYRSCAGQKPELLLGDFKKHTSKALVRAIQDDPEENRKEIFLKHFQKAAQQSSNVNNHQFWQHDNHPIELWSNEVIWQKINYVHNNPVKAGYVQNPEDYNYSSAKNYVDKQGLLDVVVFQYFG